MFHAFTSRAAELSRSHSALLSEARMKLLGPGEQEVYLVEFRCRCAVVVARGQVIRRTRGFSLVCEHVSVGG